MVGGLHTSGYLLVWATYYLSLHPEALRELVSEMRAEVGDDRGEKLNKYVYSTTSWVKHDSLLHSLYSHKHSCLELYMYMMKIFEGCKKLIIAYYM